MGKNAAFVAQPLVRKKKGTIDLSKFKAGINKNPEDNIVTAPGNRVLPGGQVRDSTPEVAEKMEIVEELRLEESTQMYSIQSADEEMLSVVAGNERMHSVKSMEDTDLLSEMNLENMTVEQIIEAQQELTERFRPDILDMLRRRGKAKVEDQKKDPELTIRKGLMPMSDKTMANKKEERDGEITRMSRVASIEDGARLTNSVDPGRHSSAAQLLPESGHLDWRKMSWVDRVEAVRSFKFGLDGAFLGCGSSTESLSLGDFLCLLSCSPGLNTYDIFSVWLFIILRVLSFSKTFYILLVLLEAVLGARGCSCFYLTKRQGHCYNYSNISACTARFLLFSINNITGIEVVKFTIHV
jgi:hypothetical protein